MLWVWNVKKDQNPGLWESLKSTFKIRRNLGYRPDFTETWKFNMIAYDYSKTIKLFKIIVKILLIFQLWIPYSSDWVWASSVHLNKFFIFLQFKTIHYFYYLFGLDWNFFILQVWEIQEGWRTGWYEYSSSSGQIYVHQQILWSP